MSNKTFSIFQDCLQNMTVNLRKTSQTYEKIDNDEEITRFQSKVKMSEKKLTGRTVKLLERNKQPFLTGFFPQVKLKRNKMKTIWKLNGSMSF